ncbi:MAG: SpoIIE family protein phosphatase [Gemmatimonadaceae bacterium]|nr:SpoIIE family protein phosphatase [Gemmatimonadaceae bacterium]
MDLERDLDRTTEELMARYEEINLLYSIGDILGRTVTLDEAAATIIVEIAETVGARRGAIYVYDDPSQRLAPVAAYGTDLARVTAIEIDDPDSVTARVFRTLHPLVVEEGELPAEKDAAVRRGAMLSVPIVWATPDGGRPLGVLSLSGRGAAFKTGDVKLVAAIATQIGTAIQNARLVRASLDQEKLAHEMQLAHDLQMRLLPRPDALLPDAEVAARVEPAEHVGGDFYQLFRFGDGRVGVLIGDVSSHGYQSALIMALAMSAMAIHGAGSADPGAAVTALHASLADELRETEMFLSLCYVVLDPRSGELAYVNTGHPHAFVVGPDGTARRLAATDPPLGMGAHPPRVERAPWDPATDLLVFFTDGITDARDARGHKLGERRVLDVLAARRREVPSRVVDGVFALVDGHMGAVPPRDDQALLVVRQRVPAAL